MRSHERDLDIRLHDVSDTNNALVWRFRRSELTLSQTTGLLTWCGHDCDVALPRMVMDKFVFDRPRTALGLAAVYACAWLTTLLVQLKNLFSTR